MHRECWRRPWVTCAAAATKGEILQDGGGLRFKIDHEAYLCFCVFMRTTIELPDDLFREAKTRAVEQGTTLKDLMIQFVRSGLGMPAAGRDAGSLRRNPPPVAIRRIRGRRPSPSPGSGELHALLEAEEVDAARCAGAGRRP